MAYPHFILGVLVIGLEMYFYKYYLKYNLKPIQNIRLILNYNKDINNILNMGLSDFNLKNKKNIKILIRNPLSYFDYVTNNIFKGYYLPYKDIIKDKYISNKISNEILLLNNKI